MKTLREFDTLPKREQIRPKKTRHTGECVKHYNHEEFPWKRFQSFLRGSLGKHINTVISDFVHSDWVPAKDRRASKIFEIVNKNVFIENGVYFYQPNYGGEFRPFDQYSNHEFFYVHPITNKLCERKPVKTNNVSNSSVKCVIIGDYHQLTKINGIWYEVKAEPKKNQNLVEIDGLWYRQIKEIPKEPEQRYVFAMGKTMVEPVKYRVLDGKILVPEQSPIRRSYTKSEYGPRDYIKDLSHSSIKITHFKQLNSKELKKHNLKNETLKKEHCEKCGGYNCQHIKFKDSPYYR
jgi:hypothetical protein